jgi:hypothetical protein
VHAANVLKEKQLQELEESRNAAKRDNRRKSKESETAMTLKSVLDEMERQRK